MSDSDSSDDEINAKLLASVDTSFLSNKLFQPLSKDDDSTTHGETVKSTAVPTVVEKSVPKSNRHLAEDDVIFHSEINVTASVQRHTAEKLSKLISSVIEFDEIETAATEEDLNGSSEETGVRLLAGFDEVIDVNEICLPSGSSQKVKIVRRKVELEEKLGDKDKIAACICDPDAFPEEVKQWKGPRKRSIEFPYKQKKDGTLVQKSDPLANEFLQGRNKNMWHESKIRRFKKRETGAGANGRRVDPYNNSGED